MAKIAISVKTSEVHDPDTGEKIEVMRITDFCRCTNKNNQKVHDLMYKGNSERKLRYIEIAGTKFIPVSEVNEFPFEASGGHISASLSHTDSRGLVVLSIPQSNQVDPHPWKYALPGILHD